MYKIVSFRYESVIQKNFARFAAQNFFCPPNHKSVPTALRQLYDVVASCRFGRLCRVHDRLWPWVRSPLVVSVLQPPYNSVVDSVVELNFCRFYRRLPGNHRRLFWSPMVASTVVTV